MFVFFLFFRRFVCSKIFTCRASRRFSTVFVGNRAEQRFVWDGGSGLDTEGYGLGVCHMLEKVKRRKWVEFGEYVCSDCSKDARLRVVCRS